MGTAEESPPRPTRPPRDGTFQGVSPAWSHPIATGELTEAPYARLDGDGRTLATFRSMPYEQRDIFAIMADDGFGGTFRRGHTLHGVHTLPAEDGRDIVRYRLEKGD